MGFSSMNPRASTLSGSFFDLDFFSPKKLEVFIVAYLRK